MHIDMLRSYVVSDAYDNIVIALAVIKYCFQCQEIDEMCFVMHGCRLLVSKIYTFFHPNTDNMSSHVICDPNKKMLKPYFKRLKNKLKQVLCNFYGIFILI